LLVNLVKSAISQYFSTLTRRIPSCFCEIAKYWIVAGYIDSHIRFISPITGKDEQSFSPTGNIITAVASKGRFLFAGSEYGELMIWLIESTGLLSSHAKFIGKISSAILSIELVNKTPLLIATSAGGEIILINYEDAMIQQILQHPKDNFPIERVFLNNLGNAIFRISFLFTFLFCIRYDNLFLLCE
jgi:hypothetical protein